MARKRNKKAEVEEEVLETLETTEAEETPSTTARKMKVIDMDKKLAEMKPTSGLTKYQQYMREKISNASKKA